MTALQLSPLIREKSDDCNPTVVIAERSERGDALDEPLESSIPGHMQKRTAVRPLDLHRHQWSLSRAVQCVIHGGVSTVSLELLPENNFRQAVVRAMRWMNVVTI